MEKKAIFLIAVLWAFSFFLYAQEASVLHLYHIEGNGVMLTIAGEGEIYSAREFPAEGVSLAPGDIIMTGRGCVAELQALPEPAKNTEYPAGPRPIIKLVENTTLRYLSSANPSAGSVADEIMVEILYGQIRVIVPGMPDYEDRGDGIGLAVKTGNMQTNIFNGDFNVDYMIHPGESLIDRGKNGTMRLQVYSFRGRTEIVQAGNSAGAGFIVNEYERVAVEMGNARSVVERKPLDSEIISFWEAIPFIGTPPDPAPDTALPLRGSRLVTNGNGEEYYVIFPIIDDEGAALANVRRKGSDDGEALSLPGERGKLRVKNGFLIGGTVLSSLGLGAILYENYGADFGLPKADIITEYNYIPYIPLGLGVISLIVSCFINPVIP